MAVKAEVVRGDLREETTKPSGNAGCPARRTRRLTLLVGLLVVTLVERLLPTANIAVAPLNPDHLLARLASAPRGARCIGCAGTDEAGRGRRGRVRGSTAARRRGEGRRTEREAGDFCASSQSRQSVRSRRRRERARDARSRSITSSVSAL